MQEELKTQLIDKSKSMRKAYADGIDPDVVRLAKGLEKNRVMELKNIFGRDNTYLVASFNDWHPVVMRTPYEIKKELK